MADWFIHAVSGLPSPLVVVVLAMAPIIELRGAVPIALGVYHYSLLTTFLLVTIASIIPAFLIIYGWGAVIKLAEQYWPAFHAFMSRYHETVHKRWERYIEAYGPWGLFLIAAIPLPLFGVWSGALIAWIFGVRPKPALLSLFLGNLIAAAIVCFLSVKALPIL